MRDSLDIQSYIKSTTTKPGVYRMLNTGGEVIYVGKAKNLKKRISTYFNKSGHTNRIKKMIGQISSIETTITKSESDALLLENVQIKKYKPKFNILLRDDKSYPYIYVDTSHPYPRLSFYRGKRKKIGKMFGPFSSVHSVRETINILQKIFKIRQCSDSFFRNRKRPCLQYQIQRCSAPCVGLIKEDSYKNDIDMSIKFLDGKNEEIISLLIKKMEEFSKLCKYEEAALCRDQINSLRQTIKSSDISNEKGDLDIIAAHIEKTSSCIQVFNVRNGINYGNEIFYPKINEDTNTSTLLSYFIAQYYMNRRIPKEIILSGKTNDEEILKKVLSNKKRSSVKISTSVRGKRQKWVSMAINNVKSSILIKKLNKKDIFERFIALQDDLNLCDVPNTIECFDISHTSGESPVGSCVVFNLDGFNKNEFRKFNINTTHDGDDYAAMTEVLSRRYTRLKKEEKELPDICLIDGGVGQVNAVIKVLESLQIYTISVIGISKGRERKPGNEKIIIDNGKKIITLSKNSKALHLLQNIRDEAHRFAITAHRKKRDKKRIKSPLEEIPGLGPKRKQVLLKYFGGIHGVIKAGEDEIQKIPGINKTLANAIYTKFHGETN